MMEKSLTAQGKIRLSIDVSPELNQELEDNVSRLNFSTKVKLVRLCMIWFFQVISVAKGLPTEVLVKDPDGKWQHVTINL